MFYQLQDPSKRILEALYQEALEKAERNCPDCGVKPGIAHHGGCDVAHCLNTGAQRLSCDCGKCSDDIWEGLWPGTKTAYEKGWIVFDTATNYLMFDYNRVAVFDQCGVDKGFVA